VLACDADGDSAVVAEHVFVVTGTVKPAEVREVSVGVAHGDVFR
jgi:hypothetical protein